MMLLHIRLHDDAARGGVNAVGAAFAVERARWISERVMGPRIQ
jgi:hypothetical protein